MGRRGLVGAGGKADQQKIDWFSKGQEEAWRVAVYGESDLADHKKVKICWAVRFKDKTQMRLGSIMEGGGELAINDQSFVGAGHLGPLEKGEPHLIKVGGVVENEKGS